MQASTHSTLLPQSTIQVLIVFASLMKIPRPITLKLGWGKMPYDAQVFMMMIDFMRPTLLIPLGPPSGAHICKS